MFTVFITFLHPNDTLIDLTVDICFRKPTARAEATIITKGTASLSDRPVYVGACKPRIYTDFLNTKTELIAEKEVISIITEPSSTPFGYLEIRRWLIR